MCVCVFVFHVSLYLSPSRSVFFSAPTSFSTSSVCLFVVFTTSCHVYSVCYLFCCIGGFFLLLLLLSFLRLFDHLLHACIYTCVCSVYFDNVPFHSTIYSSVSYPPSFCDYESIVVAVCWLDFLFFTSHRCAVFMCVCVPMLAPVHVCVRICIQVRWYNTLFYIGLCTMRKCIRWMDAGILTVQWKMHRKGA